MVYAIQIRIHGSWRTVGTCNTLDKAEVSKVNASNSYDLPARIKECASEAAAWT
ncbi:hypothetical protein MYSTI_01945 [Myxococcus stipitatus DSM 14675]|uniref:Uncharacterized protein n=1 Tax=Myxococcus stipitatus (strain DSM 14675 / JCM 12634 / Mx s8) TaxID=1278073 RepID=L7U5Z1_MYXSD|nr:hypothetical protein [Myxococcus stipitatus]AGC43275.1 hypothetical protein MYSTI_01945 [Myxococcus stipitatus DSM 14675]